MPLESDVSGRVYVFDATNGRRAILTGMGEDSGSVVSDWPLLNVPINPNLPVTRALSSPYPTLGGHTGLAFNLGVHGRHVTGGSA